MRNRRFLYGGLGLLVLLAGGWFHQSSSQGLPGPPGPPPSPCTSCTAITALPVIITQPGLYSLGGNLAYGGVGNAITIDADNVTLDLRGYEIDGTGATGSGVFIAGGRTNTAIRNGTIRNFGRHGVGLDLDFFPFPSHTEVRGVRALDNSFAGFSLGLESSAHDCRALGNGGIGISLAGVVSRCVASRNGGHGIMVGDGLVVSSSADRNGGIGILAQQATILGNSVTDNALSGIECSFGLTADNTVARNNQDGAANQSGIQVNFHCSARGNVLSQNQESQIHVVGSGSAIEANLLSATNAADGIVFAQNGNFYADNRVSVAGTPFVGFAGQTDGGGNVSF